MTRGWYGRLARVEDPTLHLQSADSTVTVCAAEWPAYTPDRRFVVRCISRKFEKAFTRTNQASEVSGSTMNVL
jgi:hypothetical protein